jgi:hypothetical protein
MAYSTERLATIAECDISLASAEKQKSNLEFEKSLLERQVANRGTTSIEVSTELTGINAELALLGNYIASLPEGTSKRKKVKEQQKLEHRKAILDERAGIYSTFTYLDSQFDLACVLKEIEEVNVFIAALQARKAEL